MSTYLSVDLDFWNQGEQSFTHLHSFLTKVKERINRIAIIDSHEEILPHVNQSRCDRLINIDWHSDICNKFDPTKIDDLNFGKLNCGTWANYVRFRQHGLFTWIHPHLASVRGSNGYCHYPYKDQHNPFIHSELAGWKATKQIRNKNPEDIIDWQDCYGAAIVFSYDWVHFKEIHDIAEKVFGRRAKKSLKPKL